MYKIEIVGLTGRKVCGNGKEEYLQVPKENYKLYENVECQEGFAEYTRHGEGIDDRFREGIIGGYMSFFIKDEELYVKVSYDSMYKLDDKSLEELADETQGQLSDGIGEGFEQYPCIEDENGVDHFLSPWYGGQVLTTTQELDISELNTNELHDLVIRANKRLSDTRFSKFDR